MALEILGLDGLSESVYRALLTDPDSDLDAVAARLGVQKHEVREALGRLIQLSLVAERVPGRMYVPIDPDVALDTLLLLEQAELSRRERQLLEARAELAKLMRIDDTQAAPREIRRLDDAERTLDVLHDLSARCEQEALSVVAGEASPAGALADALQYDLALLNRGITCRLLHTRRQLQSRPTRKYLRTLQSFNAQIRVADTLPHRLVVFDRSVSLLPVDPRRPRRGALVVREPAIVANLVMLFESLWSTAQTLDQALEYGEPAVSDLDRSVLILMSSGVKDEAAARQLSVSDRTYRRHVADILVRLGASSRFQAGVEAVRRGWL